MRGRWAAALTGVIALGAAASATAEPLVRVSTDILPRPAPPEADRYTRQSQAEPQIAVDPENGDHLVGVWHEDRFRHGGAPATLERSLRKPRGRRQSDVWTTRIAG